MPDIEVKNVPFTGTAFLAALTIGSTGGGELKIESAPRSRLLPFSEGASETGCQVQGFVLSSESLSEVCLEFGQGVIRSMWPEDQSW